MDIKRSGSQASTKGPSDWFTGTVRIDPLFQASDPARYQEQASRTVGHGEIKPNAGYSVERSRGHLYTRGL
jgi:hypothetical protein